MDFIRKLTLSQSIYEIELYWKQLRKHSALLTTPGLKKKAFATRIRALINISVQLPPSNLDIGLNKALGAMNSMKMRFNDDDKVKRQCANIQSEILFLKSLFDKPEELDIPLFSKSSPVKSMNTLLKNQAIVFRIYEIYVVNQPSLEIRKANLTTLFVRLALILQMDSLDFLFENIKTDILLVSSIAEKQSYLQQLTYCLTASLRRDIQHGNVVRESVQSLDNILKSLLHRCEDHEFNPKSFSNILAYIQLVTATRLSIQNNYDEILKDIILHRGIINNFDSKQLNEHDFHKITKYLFILSKGLEPDDFANFCTKFDFIVNCFIESTHFDYTAFKRIFETFCVISKYLPSEKRLLYRDQIIRLLDKIDTNDIDIDSVAVSLSIKALLLFGFKDDCFNILEKYKATQTLQSVHHMLDYLNEKQDHESILKLAQLLQLLSICPTNTTIDKISQSFFSEGILKQDKNKIQEGIGFIISLSKLYNVRIQKITKERVEFITSEFEIQDSYKQFLYDIDFRYHNDEVDEDFLN